LKEYLVADKFDFDLDITPTYEYRTETPTLNMLVQKQTMSYNHETTIFVK